MVAHDGSANLLQPPNSNNPYDSIQVNNTEDEEIIRQVAQYTDKKVRVVKIEKTTEALVSFVLNLNCGFLRKHTLLVWKS